MVKNLHKINKQPPPHVYAMAQSVYMAAVTTRRDQSLIPMGCQASGKTTSCKHVLQYLVQTAVPTNKVQLFSTFLLFSNITNKSNLLNVLFRLSLYKKLKLCGLY